MPTPLAEVELSMRVEGMECEECEKSVFEALRSLPGVKRAEVSLPHIALVQYDPAVTRPEELTAAVRTASDKFKALPFMTHKWKWRGHTVNYATAGCGKPIVLIHGFGASVAHWKKNIPVLAEHGYKVYALDLLGFGDSDKADVEYSIDLWKEMTLDFIDEFVHEPCVVAGNSIGGLITCAVSYAAPEKVKASVLVQASCKFRTSEVQRVPYSSTVGTSELRKLALRRLQFNDCASYYGNHCQVES
eukprot:tig00000241_g21016.t1